MIPKYPLSSVQILVIARRRRTCTSVIWRTWMRTTVTSWTVTVKRWLQTSRTCRGPWRSPGPLTRETAARSCTWVWPTASTRSPAPSKASPPSLLSRPTSWIQWCPRRPLRPASRGRCPCHTLKRRISLGFGLWLARLPRGSYWALSSTARSWGQATRAGIASFRAAGLLLDSAGAWEASMKPVLRAPSPRAHPCTLKSTALAATATRTCNCTVHPMLQSRTRVSTPPLKVRPLITATCCKKWN